MPLSRIKTLKSFQKYRIAHELTNGILVKTDTTLTNMVFSKQMKNTVNHPQIKCSMTKDSCQD
jgi:hypothetical protein